MNRILQPRTIARNEEGYKKGELIRKVNSSYPVGHPENQLGRYMISEITVLAKDLHWQSHQLLLVDTEVEITKGCYYTLHDGTEWVLIYCFDNEEADRCNNNSITKSRCYKIIASAFPHIPGTLPIADKTVADMVGFNMECEVRVEMRPDMDYVGQDSTGRDQYAQVGEVYPTDQHGNIIAEVVRKDAASITVDADCPNDVKQALAKMVNIASHADNDEELEAAAIVESNKIAVSKNGDADERLVNLFKAGCNFQKSRTEQQVTRVEIIDSNGRSYVNMNVKSMELSYQDVGKTLKIFIDQK